MSTPRAYYNDIDPYACRVLRKQIRAGNLPPGDVDDRSITDVDPAELRDYTQIHLFAGIGGIPYGLRLAGVPDALNIITGGFPCQDISNAGQRAGITGARSGLWFRYAALIRQLRPRYVLVENVAALTSRGLDRVLGDLAASGYDAEWDCIPASAVGAPHQRDRLWLVAYPMRERVHIEPQPIAGSCNPLHPDRDGVLQRLADAHGERCQEQHATTVADGPRQPDWRGDAREVRHTPGKGSSNRADKPMEGSAAPPELKRSDWWAAEPAVGRVAHGIPRRVDRLRGLGNAVVPHVVAVIGAAIRRHAEL
jgi:DNA (cytosine-5)-methyltransferase 1